jgi:hypothetical protein
MSGESQLLLMIAGVHFVGLACVTVLILPALRDGGDPPPRDPPDQSSDDGWGNNRRRPKGPSGLPRGGLPLPDAVQSRVRLREPGRISELVPSRERRPAREPSRRPIRAPHRVPSRGPERVHRRSLGRTAPGVQALG